MKRSCLFHFFFAIGLAASIGVIGCSGSNAGVETTSSPNAPSSTDLSGAWTGQWLSSTGVGGTLAGTITQTGSSLDGDFRATGSACLAGAHLTGTVDDGRHLNGAWVAGGLDIPISGTYAATSIDGTYQVAAGGACGGDIGTFSLHR